MIGPHMTPFTTIISGPILWNQCGRTGCFHPWSANFTTNGFLEWGSKKTWDSHGDLRSPTWSWAEKYLQPQKKWPSKKNTHTKNWMVFMVLASIKPSLKPSHWTVAPPVPRDLPCQRFVFDKFSRSHLMRFFLPENLILSGQLGNPPIKKKHKL